MKLTALKNALAILLLLIVSDIVLAQNVKEIVQPLTKKSYKGFMSDVNKDDNGNIRVKYKIPGDKKANEVFYQEYSFDKDLKFIENKDVNEAKEAHADYEAHYNSVSVGGCTSFDILSMKLRLTKIVALKTWNNSKNRYVVKKIISNDMVKVKNEEGTKYIGYASFNTSDDTKNNVAVLAKANSKDKKEADKFSLLLLDADFNITPKPIDLNGSYSLVYCDQLENDDIVIVFAPNKGTSDASSYIYMQYDMAGNQKSKIEFKSPASALLITAMFEKNGTVYFCGTSTKSNDPFEKVFSEYASINSPCFTGARNPKDFNWEKACGEKMTNFHLLKFSNNQLSFASTTPVNEFKTKIKVAPGEKGADPYKGKKFYIAQFMVTPDEDYLIAGQLTSSVRIGGSYEKTYEDIVCLHFDKAGVLKAQYGVQKLNNDKKSEIFDMVQNFYLSADGKSVTWEINEVKGLKGYADFFDAYNGIPTFYRVSYPRIGSIDLTNSSVSAFKVLGNGKYFLSKTFPGIYDGKDRTISYFGHDADGKNLWVSKISLP